MRGKSGLWRETPGVILLVLSALFLQACSHDPPASTQKLPDYPGASAVTERKLDTSDVLLNIYKSVSFTTSDSPEVVLKFYRDTLSRDGWQIDPLQPDPDGLAFTWAGYEQPPTSYMCSVTARPNGNGMTRVEIELRYNPGS
jgi:hypothetical protein